MRIPTWENSASHAHQTPDHEKLVELDQTKKAKMKEYADACGKARPSTVQEGDWMLVRQEQKKKTDSRHCEQPLQVTVLKGTTVTAVSDNKQDRAPTSRNPEVILFHLGPLRDRAGEECKNCD
ncbi:hypothetical protein NDU88_007450 [Pleurodeles waltl]|uniref:Uncharacterized protein n=1 Tax=Pleurodeles waltl TaxID=8319 RepID=A0AAV7RQ60_PLEWA|nr:hypothetical protein NDU88_007450 [Pleurodeles waltl]